MVAPPTPNTPAAPNVQGTLAIPHVAAPGVAPPPGVIIAPTAGVADMVHRGTHYRGFNRNLFSATIDDTLQLILQQQHAAHATQTQHFQTMQRLQTAAAAVQAQANHAEQTVELRFAEYRAQVQAQMDAYSNAALQLEQELRNESVELNGYIQRLHLQLEQQQASVQQAFGTPQMRSLADMFGLFLAPVNGGYQPGGAAAAAAIAEEGEEVEEMARMNIGPSSTPPRPVKEEGAASAVKKEKKDEK